MLLLLHQHGDDAPLHLERVLVRLVEHLCVQLQLVHEGVDLLIDLAALLVVLGQQLLQLDQLQAVRVVY